MGEHHSILYGPINALLIRLLGEPPVEKLSPALAAFFFPDGKEAWIPDPAIMTLLLLLIFAIFFPWAARRLSTATQPGKLQSFLEMLVSGPPRPRGRRHRRRTRHRRYLPMIGALAVFIGVREPLRPLLLPAAADGIALDDGRARRRLVRLLQRRGHPGARSLRVPRALHGADAADRAALLRDRDHRHVRAGSSRCRCASS